MKFIVFVYVHRQSPDIAGGVDSALEVRDGGSEDVFATGAGDQGTVYGYATRGNLDPSACPQWFSQTTSAKVWTK